MIPTSGRRGVDDLRKSCIRLERNARLLNVGALAQTVCSLLPLAENCILEGSLGNIMGITEERVQQFST